MAYLQIDLWPAAWVLGVAAAAIVAMRAAERLALARATERTQRALERALASLTDG